MSPKLPPVFLKQIARRISSERGEGEVSRQGSGAGLVAKLALLEASTAGTTLTQTKRIKLDKRDAWNFIFLIVEIAFRLIDCGNLSLLLTTKVKGTIPQFSEKKFI
jgi:hypothetical protein